MKTENTDLYLEKYAEVETREGAAFPLGEPWQQVVVVPSFGENQILDDCFAALELAAHREGGRVLVVLFVNGDNSAPEYGEKNRELLLRLKGKQRAAGPLARSYFLEPVGHIDVLLVDRTWELGDIACGQGVGWARKFGCDLALKAISEGKVVSPWIHTTDADARVTENYFDFSSPVAEYGLGKEVGVVLHPFEHEGAWDFTSPMGLYDLWLRYYEAGLRFARSPYAFPTVGSLVSIHAKTYAEVRGFPKREAAEDFYLLAKAAKVAAVSLTGGMVRLRNRPSSRVPFGTGVGTRKIRERLEMGSLFTLYHPETFHWLKVAIEQAEKLSDDYVFPAPVRRCLEHSGYFGAVAESRERKTEADRRRTFHSHWDAFKTLKFVHWMRDNGWPEIPWETALDTAEISEIALIDPRKKIRDA